MREKFCMRCGTPLNGAAQCPACGYEPQHDACEGPGGPVPEGQSAAQPAAEPTPAAPREATAGTAARAARGRACPCRTAGRCARASGPAGRRALHRVCGSPAGAAPAGAHSAGRGTAALWPGARHGAARLGRPAARPGPGPAGGQAGRAAVCGARRCAAARPERQPGAGDAALCRARGLCTALDPLGAAARAPYAGPHRRHAAGGGAAAGGVDCAADLGV